MRYLVWSRLHCALGDVLILLGCFWLVALIWRDRRWIAAGRLAPRLLFVALGLAYTAASELLNTRFFLSWAYAPEMPHIFGIGLAPILQWLLIPSVLLFILGPSRALASGLPREGEQGAAAPDREARARGRGRRSIRSVERPFRSKEATSSSTESERFTSVLRSAGCLTSRVYVPSGNPIGATRLGSSHAKR